MSTQLVFKSHVLETIEHNGKTWFTAATLATALEYSDARSVTNIYTRNTDEFTLGMSEVIKMLTPDHPTKFFAVRKIPQFDNAALTGLYSASWC